eukprot:scaffold7037_cov311-Pinguiococcus_pyrenoidosus.AAC.5
MWYFGRRISTLRSKRLSCALFSSEVVDSLRSVCAESQLTSLRSPLFAFRRSQPFVDHGLSGVPAESV